MTPSGRRPNLTALNDAVTLAGQRDRARLDDGVAVPVMRLASFLDERGTRAVWNVVRLLRDRAPDVYNKFVGELGLFYAILDVVEEYDYGGAPPMFQREPVARMEWPTLVQRLSELTERE